MKNRQAIILVGPPGSGKSTRVKTLLEALGRENAVVLSTDYYIQERAKVENLSFNEGIEIFMSDAVQHLRYMKSLALNAGKAVIVDRTNMTRGARRSLIGEFIKFGYAVTAVEFEFDPDELLVRNMERKKVQADIPIDIISDMVARYEPPTYDEGFTYIYKMPRKLQE